MMPLYAAVTRQTISPPSGIYPVLSAYAAEGYEVAGAPLYYGLSAGFASDAEPMVRDVIVQMLNQC